VLRVLRLLHVLRLLVDALDCLCPFWLQNGWEWYYRWQTFVNPWPCL